MHKLNFCGTLCLPKEVEGHKARGIQYIKEFEEGYVTPMARPFSEFHLIYSSKPALFDNNFKFTKFLGSQDLDNKAKVDYAMSKNVYSADHALDISTLADGTFKNRDDSLKTIIDRLFSKGHENVILWSNNGIGQDFDGEEGILRSELGVAYGSVFEGKEKPAHQRGIKDSYQNSAHQHMHIAPDTGFYTTLSSILNSMHTHCNIDTLSNQRELMKREGITKPYISVCCVNKNQSLSEELMFNNLSEANNVLSPDYSMSAFIRTVITNYNLKERGLDFSEKGFMKEEIKRSEELF